MPSTKNHLRGLIPPGSCVLLWNKNSRANWQVRNSDRCSATGLLLGHTEYTYHSPWNNIFSVIKNRTIMNGFFAFWFSNLNQRHSCCWVFWLEGCHFLSSHSFLRLLTVLCFLFQVPGESEKEWKPALVVLTEKDLLIYDSMPRRKEAWLSPVHTCPLLATR